MVENPAKDPRILSTSDDEEEEWERSRTSLKKERVNNEQALTELALRLLEQNRTHLQSLGVSENVADALDDLRKIKSHAAKARQLRLVRARLRDLDWMSVRAALDQKRAGFAPLPGTDEPRGEARTWTEQLLIQKDEGLSRFVREFESNQRQRLRQLVRNVNQAGEAKRHKARKLLLSAVQEVIDLSAARNEQNQGPDDHD